MNKKTAITAIFLLFLFVFTPVKSFAFLNNFDASEIFNADSVKLLAKEAKIIIKGEVKSVKSSKGINDVVYARASVLISDFIKGKTTKKNIVVEYKEGETEDAPSLEQDEEVVLFLTNSFWRKNVYYLVGGSFGKYAVCSDNTIKIESSCDEKNTNETTDEENLDAEFSNLNEKNDTEAKIMSDKKETLDDLLSEIKN